MSEPDVKAVRMVREIRDELYRKTEGMTTEELIRFFRDGAQATRQRFEKLRPPGQRLTASTR